MVRRPPAKSYLVLLLLIIGPIALWAYYLVLDYRYTSYDIAITNVVIHDGANNKGFIGSVGIKGDKIAKVWKGRTWLINPKAVSLIDGKGRHLSPGFIDSHSHADLSIGSNGAGNIRADNFVGQGVTTVIAGNCGRSPADISAFARNLRTRKLNVNIAILIGLGSVRKKVMNESSAAASASESARMCELVRAGMNAGALGVSSGFAYPPGIFASRAETVAQLKIACQFGGIHATHMRSEGGDIIRAVEEVVDYSETAGIPLVISHFKITGLSNCGKYVSLKKIITGTRSRGNKVFVDFYPYDASSTNLNIFLPDWYLALDRKSKTKTLASESGQARIRNDIKEILKVEGFDDFRFAVVSYYAPRRDWQGISLDKIARRNGISSVSKLDDQIDVFLEIEKNGGAQMTYHNMCPDLVDRLPKEEENMVGSDSAIRFDNAESLPHPRGWGAFPRFIRRFVIEKKLLSLDEAVFRMTGLPAETFKLNRRGRIKKDYFADLVLFDPARIQDRSTYDDPFASPRGILCVLVNGIVVVDKRALDADNDEDNTTGVLNTFPGKFLKKGI